MWWRLKETSVSALKLYSELPAWWKYFHKVMCIPSPLAHIFWIYPLDTIDKNHIFCIFTESVAPHANTISAFKVYAERLMVNKPHRANILALYVHPLKWTWRVRKLFYIRNMAVFKLNDIHIQKCIMVGGWGWKWRLFGNFGWEGKLHWKMKDIFYFVQWWKVPKIRNVY